MARVLTKLRIDEVSAVDRAAGEGTKIVLMKRHDAPTEAASRRAYFLKIFTSKADADDGNDDADDRSDDAGSLASHPVVSLARLLIASGHEADIASALHYLLNTSHGAALLHRVRTLKAAKDDPPMQDNLTKIAADIGVVAVAKTIVREQRSYGIDEAAFVALVTQHAKAAHPNLTEAQAFAKVYESEPSIWQACAILKTMPFVADPTPLMVGGIDAQNEANDATEQSKAYAQLQQIGRDRWPTASEAQQFANAMTDSKNAALAAKVHIRPSPTTSFQFPR
jgi:hypothetical protein